MEHLMVPLEGSDEGARGPNITPELKQKVIDGVTRETAGRSVEQLANDENGDRRSSQTARRRGHAVAFEEDLSGRRNGLNRLPHAQKGVML